MGIFNISFLKKEDPMDRDVRKVQEMVRAKRIDDHHRGKHNPYGMKRRDCPLCNPPK